MLTPMDDTASGKAETGAPGQARHDITRLTPTYDRAQDRLRVAIETKAGAVLVLWLTQRVSNQIVMALARWLEADVKQLAEGRNAAPLHGFEQSAAVAQHRAQTAVAAQKARDCGLVHQVDMSRKGERYSLALHTTAGDTAQLRSGATEMRQLLDIFRRMYQAGEWSTAGWPRWAAQEPEVAAKTPEARKALH